MKSHISAVLLCAASAAAFSVSVRPANAAEATTLAEVAKSWSDWLRALPEPDFGAPGGPAVPTQAQGGIGIVAGWVKQTIDALAVPETAAQQPTMGQDFARTAAATVHDASQPFEPAVAANEPTLATSGAVTAAASLPPLADAALAQATTAVATVTAMLPDLGQQPQQQAELPASGSTSATSPSPVSSQASPPAEVASAAQPSNAGPKAEDPVPPEPGTEDAKLADQAAEMMDQVSKGATRILKGLNDGQQVAQADQPASASQTNPPAASDADSSETVPPEPGTEPDAMASPATPETGSQRAVAISSWTYQPQGKAKGLLVIEGEGPPGLALTVYLDGAKIGAATPAIDGSWTLDARAVVAPGKHTVKAGLAAVAGQTQQVAVLTFVTNRGSAPAGSSPAAAATTAASADLPAFSPTPLPKLAKAPSGSSTLNPGNSKIAGDLTAEVNQSLAMSARLVPSLRLAYGKLARPDKPVRPTRHVLVANLPRQAPRHENSGGNLVWVRVYRGGAPVLVHVPEGTTSAFAGTGQE